MFAEFVSKSFLLLPIVCSLSLAVLAQNEDTLLRVATEEIKINVTVRNEFGHFDPSLRLEDLMVVEDGVPHKIESLRRVPASVLIILDTGGESRFAKNLQTTRAAATSLAANLSAETAVAVMQYSDKPEILCEWTTERTKILAAVNKQSSFGKNSKFVEALNLAARFIAARPNENRHLVFIGDGTDSTSDLSEREKALKNIIAANVSVHVLSYTRLEIQALTKIPVLRGGDGQIPKRTDENNKIALPQPVKDLMNLPRLGSINLDREMIRARRAQQQSLQDSEKDLEKLTTETGGEIYLPIALEDLPEEAKSLALTIDSNYVLTYAPKRPLAASPKGEIRQIGVVPRRVGLSVQSRRLFVVPTKN
jgi:VWFA-related protein